MDLPVETKNPIARAHNQLAFAALALCAALSSAAGASQQTAVAPPANLTYSLPSPVTYWVQIKGDVSPGLQWPSSTGGAVTLYTVSPALPSGFTIDPTYGFIDGYAFNPSPLTTYTVTASNAGGSTSCQVQMQILAGEHLYSSYLVGPTTLTVGTAMYPVEPLSETNQTTITFTFKGPALPPGLHFDPATATISGTPTAVSPQTTYKVSVTDGIATVIDDVTFTVIAPVAPPASLTYATNPATFTVGKAIAADQPSSTGGAPTAYSVSPALPAGLILDTATGVVSGTPGAAAALATYSVTASNSAGSTSVALKIAVNAAVVPPANLTYATNPATYTAGKAITPDNPSSTGGAPTHYAVSPALPAGLLLSATTGVVSGTPSAAAAKATYTVTASNSAGNTKALLQIKVNAAVVPPANLTYATNPATFTTGKAITPDNPSSTGGAPTHYAVSPVLPAGLALSATTGVVSGTPTAAAAKATYTVTASNSGGSAKVALLITVNAAVIPPANLTYAKNPATFTVAVAATPDAPSSTGGAPTAYAVTPALPAGLSLNAKSGVISGTPTAVAAAAKYTVTASNSAGSATALLTITVEVLPPVIAYSSGSYTFATGTALVPLLATNSGGAAQSFSVSPALPAGLSLNVATGTISGTPTAASATSSYIVTASNAAGSGTAALGITVVTEQPGAFASGGDLLEQRYLHTATLLNDGKVLVACGANDTVLSSTELYDPAARGSAPADEAQSPRFFHSATGLQSGDVLIVGGVYRSGTVGQPTDAVFYDHAAGTFRTTAGLLHDSRSSHTSTRLSDGRVLIAGGYQNVALSSAELYVPATDSFVLTGSLNVARSSATATLLQNGKVLVVGGGDPNTGINTGSAELYDPTLGRFTNTGSLIFPRQGHTATLLPSGKVLITGGVGATTAMAVRPSLAVVPSAEIYDPATGTFSATVGFMSDYRSSHTATLLQNGKVLIAGGKSSDGQSIGTAEIYDPAADAFTQTGTLVMGRYSHTATLLPGGSVLLTGGLSGDATLSSTEIYTP